MKKSMILSDFYWENCQELMKPEDYERFIESNIMNGEIDIVYLNPTSTRSSSITTPKKTLKIAKSCSSNCAISVTATWKSNPAVRSYDVIGAYLENTKLVSTPFTTVVSSATNKIFDDVQKFTNGFGVSVKIPSSGANVTINQSYRVTKGGKVYASYQHATKNVSLEASKLYSISTTGYGHVFSFMGSVSNSYDRMNGVSISLD